jgi:SAM-dependent methyltransferase
MDSIGANKLRRVWVDRYVRPRPNDRILDVGCGTGAVVAFLPEGVDYLGVDLSADYIAAAERRYGARARFRVGDVTNIAFEQGQSFDVISAIGLLHHLDDDEVRHLARTARGLLTSNGRFITIDNCFTPEQSPVAKAIIRRDRGRNVRTPDQYQAVIQQEFDRITREVRHDLLRIPYTHVIFEAQAA